jgi:hypothetical protein
MIVNVYKVREAGFKIPSREADCQHPMKGALRLERLWVSDTRTKRALVLRKVSDVTSNGLISVLYEPDMTALGDSWMRFKGWEILEYLGRGRQLVVQEWRCVLAEEPNKDNQSRLGIPPSSEPESV